jgi:hypothetical protein
VFPSNQFPAGSWLETNLSDKLCVTGQQNAKKEIRTLLSNFRLEVTQKQISPKGHVTLIIISIPFLITLS